MAYIAFADFRAGAGLAEYCTGLALTVAEASDAALTAAIVRMSARFDDLTNDHFESASSTYDLSGDGTTKLQLPQRCTALTTVKTRDSLGNLTTQASTVYRLESSLDSAGASRLADDASDFVAIVRWQYLSGIEGDPSRWPCGTKTVQVVGTFGWTATPGDVKRAVALMVWDHFRTLDDKLRRAQQVQTADRTITYDSGPDAPTGLTEADAIIRAYTRSPGLAVG